MRRRRKHTKHGTHNRSHNHPKPITRGRRIQRTNPLANSITYRLGPTRQRHNVSDIHKMVIRTHRCPLTYGLRTDTPRRNI